MDPHFETIKHIRGKEVKLVFFDKSKNNIFNQDYVSLIENTPKLYKDYISTRWFLKDSSYNYNGHHL